MPAYPCAKCDHQVDLRDMVCRSCGDKKPFKCTKCDKRLGSMDVFQADEITIRKPLYCSACGRDQEALKCSHCQTTLVRRDGIEVTSKTTGAALIFHPECHRTYQLQLTTSRALKYVLTPAAAYMGYTFMERVHSMMGILGIAAGICVGLGIAWMMDPKK